MREIDGEKKEFYEVDQSFSFVNSILGDTGRRGDGIFILIKGFSDLFFNV